MKKRILTALSIIGLGLMLVVIGCALGGNLHDSESTSGEAASGTLGDGVTVRKLLIDTSLVSLTVKPHSKAVFEYTISGEPEIIASVSIVNRDVLKITSRKKNAFWGRSYPKGKRITVYVPHNAVFDQVSLSAGVGEVLLEGITAQNGLSLDTGVGEVELRSVTASKVTAHTSIGTVRFKDCVFTDTEIRSGMGELYFSGKLHGTTTISAGVGEATLHLQDRREDYVINVSAGIGEVSIDGRQVSSGILPAVNETGNKAHRLNIRSSIGEVSVRFDR